VDAPLSGGLNVHKTRLLSVSVLLAVTGLVGTGCSSSAPLTTGSLQITVTGPPGGAAAAVMVTGPSGYSQAVSATTTLSRLVPGMYTITTTSVVITNATYGAAAIAVDVVASNTPAAASVSYVVVSGALAINVTGLSSSVSASVDVTGPNGFTQTIKQSQTLYNLLPQTYTVTAKGVTERCYDGTCRWPGFSLEPSPATQTIVVSASLTPETVSIQYKGTRPCTDGPCRFAP